MDNAHIELHVLNTNYLIRCTSEKVKAVSEHDKYHASHSALIEF